MSDEPDEPDEVVQLEITDELDLHTFRPQEVGELVADYLDECVARGFPRVRIIHGKGTGALRRTVHAALDRHDAVDRYQLGDESSGQWGATLVWLRQR